MMMIITCETLPPLPPQHQEDKNHVDKVKYITKFFKLARALENDEYDDDDGFDSHASQSKSGGVTSSVCVAVQQK